MPLRPKIGSPPAGASPPRRCEPSCLPERRPRRGSAAAGGARLPRAVDLALGGSRHYDELHALRARRFLYVSPDGLGRLVIRVDQQGDYAGLWKQFGKKLQPLGI